jgi:peptidyl-prolyl cis-trans isomerase D
MLDLMRKKAQSLFIQLTIGAIVLVFVFWGIGANQGSKANIVATVDDTTISYNDFRQQYNRTLSEQREKFGGNLPEDLLVKLINKPQVLDQMVQRILLRKGAEESGVNVSDEEVRQLVKETDVFRSNGSFDLARYQQVLAGAQLNATDYEAGVKSDLLTQKVIDNLGRFAKVSSGLVEDRFSYAFEEISLDYVALAPDDFTKKVKIKNEELAAFFDKYKNRYKTDPEVKLFFVSFPFDNEEGKTLAYKNANEAYEKIILTGSLDKYAASEKKIIEKTAFFPRKSPPSQFTKDPAFLNASFNIKKGELSSIVELQKAFAILFVDDIKVPEIPLLNIVKKPVEKDFIADKSKTLAEKAAKSLLAKLKEGADLKDEAKKLGATIQKSPVLVRSQQTGGDLPESIVANAFKLTMENPYPEAIGTGNDQFYVYKLAEKKQPEPALLEAKKDALEKQLLQENKLMLLAAWLDNVKSEADITINEQYLE